VCALAVHDHSAIGQLDSELVDIALKGEVLTLERPVFGSPFLFRHTPKRGMLLDDECGFAKIADDRNGARCSRNRVARAEFLPQRVQLQPRRRAGTHSRPPTGPAGRQEHPRVVP